MDRYSHDLREACLVAGVDLSGDLSQQNTNFIKVAVDLIWSNIMSLFDNTVAFKPGKYARDLWTDWKSIQKQNAINFKTLLTDQTKQQSSEKYAILEYWLYDVINPIEQLQRPNPFGLNESWNKLKTYRKFHTELCKSDAKWTALSRLADLIYAMNVDSCHG